MMSTTKLSTPAVLLLEPAATLCSRGHDTNCEGRWSSQIVQQPCQAPAALMGATSEGARCTLPVPELKYASYVFPSLPLSELFHTIVQSENTY